MDAKYVEEHTIFEAIVGSQAYGISTPDSDFDKSGVMIPGLEYFYGLDKFDQFSNYPDEDKTIYNIKKALILLADNNPNMMDLLFIPERCIIKMTPYWQVFMENRDLFVSKKCRYIFSGYAYAGKMPKITTCRCENYDVTVRYSLKDSRFEIDLPEEMGSYKEFKKGIVGSTQEEVENKFKKIVKVYFVKK